MTEVAFWFVHTVTVDTFLGSGSHGPVWNTDNTVACWVEETTDLVRDSAGDEVVSTAKVFAALGDRAAFTVGSKVALPSGRVAQVLAVSVFDSGSLKLGLDHVEVSLK